MKQKLKGVHALERIFTDMFAEFGIRKVSMGKDYAYWYNLEEITFCPYEKIEDKWFNEFVTNRFPDITLGSSLIIGFLHEVGHHETMDDISEVVQSMCDEEKERIETEIENSKSEERIKELEWEYFNLPDEIIATYWAVEYIRQNLEQVNRMNNLAELAIKKFYAINNIN